MERPSVSPLISDHLTKIPIGSSVSQIAISETSRKPPPKPDIKGGRLREVPLYTNRGIVWSRVEYNYFGIALEL